MSHGQLVSATVCVAVNHSSRILVLLIQVLFSAHWWSWLNCVDVQGNNMPHWDKETRQWPRDKMSVSKGTDCMGASINPPLHPWAQLTALAAPSVAHCLGHPVLSWHPLATPFRQEAGSDARSGVIGDWPWPQLCYRVGIKQWGMDSSPVMVGADSSMCVTKYLSTQHTNTMDSREVVPWLVLQGHHK